ncbi:ComEC/Rec2 family competence protein [Henriciella sp. AS95]|uniref:ComEC/Rec2 family competence protein n=1 Tax=Henriciella sp. AS95 TaxID=3135782 RepID=UPI00316B0537
MIGFGFAGVTVLATVLRRLQLPNFVQLIVILAVGAVSGMLAGKVQTEWRSSPVISRTIGPTMIEGWVADVEPGSNGVRLRIDVTAIGGEVSADLPHQVRMTHALSLNVEPGRFVRCWGVLRPPPQPAIAGDYDFSRQAYFDGLGAVGYVQGRCRAGALSGVRHGFDGLSSQVAQWRRALAKHVVARAATDAGGFAAALTSGDRSFMPSEDVEALRKSGLAHLLAISGLHLGLVGGLVYFTFRRGLSLWEWLAVRFPVQKIAAFAAIVATAAYLVLSGASISTQRAFIMAAVFFGAIVLDRSPLSLRSFAIAMILVLILEPQSVMSPGFQMSFAATGGLIASFEAWTRYRRDRGQFGGGIGMVVKSLVLTSVVGAAATAPFALYHFDRLAPLGLAANLLAMPIFTFVSAPAAGLALLTWPLGLSDIFLSVFGWSLERIQDIAAWAAAGGGDGFQLGRAMPDITFLCLVVAIALACLMDGVIRKSVAVGITAVSAFLAFVYSPIQILHISASGDVFVTEDKDVVQRMKLTDGDGLPPLRYADLEPAGDCSGQACMLNTKLGPILISGQAISQSDCEAVRVVVTTSPISQTCISDGVLSFTAVDAPVSVYRSALGKISIRKPRCGRRPWSPCLQ